MVDFACKRLDINDLIKCSLGLTKGDYDVLNLLLSKHGKSFSVKEISEILEKDRSSIQKSVSALLEKKIIKKFQENLNPRGYRFTYNAIDRDDIRKMIFKTIETWNSNVSLELDKW